MRSRDVNKFVLTNKQSDLQLVVSDKDPAIRGSEIYNINLSGEAIPGCMVENFIGAYKMECKPYSTYSEFEESFTEKFLDINIPKKKPLFLQPVVLRNVSKFGEKVNPHFVDLLPEDAKVETFASFDLAGRIGDIGLVFGDAKAYSAGGVHGDKLSQYHFVGTPFDGGILISKNPRLNETTKLLLDEMFEKHRQELNLVDVEQREVGTYLQEKSFPLSGEKLGVDRGVANVIAKMQHIEKYDSPIATGKFSLAMRRYSTFEQVPPKRKRLTK